MCLLRRRVAAPETLQLPSIRPPLGLINPLRRCGGREREASGGYNELGVYLGVPRPLTRDIINQEGPTLKRNGGAPEGPRNAAAGSPAQRPADFHLFFICFHNPAASVPADVFGASTPTVSIICFKRAAARRNMER